MKLLKAFILLCIFGGALTSAAMRGPPMRGRGQGRNPSDCRETCQAEEKCPTTQSVRMRLASRSQECRDCIAEECGDARPNMRGSDDMGCRRDAYMDCEECPTLTADEQTQMRTCRQCLRNCSSKQGGRPGKRPSPGPGRFNLIQAAFSSFRCMNACEAPNRCPRRDEQTFRANQECRQCIRNACGPKNETDRSCISEARDNCPDCPDMPDEEQVRMRNCTSCIRKCAPRRGKNRGPLGGESRRPAFLVLRPFRRLSCMRRCRSESTCPNVDAIMMDMEGSPQGCRDCLFEECGYFNRFNRSEVADCIVNARMTCAGCPIMTSSQQTRMRGCNACVRRCFGGPSRHQRGSSRGLAGRFPRPGSYGDGNSMIPDGESSCLLSCEGPTKCMSSEGFSAQIEMIQGDCLQCVEEECGEVNLTNRYERIDCALSAGRDCSACPPVSAEQRDRMRNCKSCLRKCSPRGNRPGPPKPIRSLHPLGRLLCIRNCRSSATCPATEETMNALRGMREECRTCVREYCGSLNQTNQSARVDCITVARQECSECPTLSPEEQMRARGCRHCVRRCASIGNEGREGNRFRRPSPVGTRIFRRMSCMRNCRSSEECPRIEEIRSNIMSTRMECRQCIVEECGEFNQSNRSEIAECIMEARQDCEECPTLSDRNQTRRRRCMSCVRGCLPLQGRSGKKQGFKRRFPRRPFQLMSCMKRCASQDQCPRREDLINRFQRNPRACRECVMEECASLEGGDEGDLADCIDEQRESCLACPDRDPEEQGRRQTCRSCIRNCVANSDRCEASEENENSSLQGRPSNRPGQSGSQGSTIQSNDISPERAACRSSCVSSDSCPETDHRENFPQVCLNCIQQRNCRSLPPLRTGQCVIQAQSTCPMCPPLTETDRSFFRTCSACVANCLQSSQTGHPGAGQGGSRPGQGGPRPGQGGPRPGQGGPRPVQGGPRPGQGGPRPGQGGPRPGQGGPRPGEGGRRPGQGGPRPGQGGPRPSQGGPRPGQGGPRPGQGSPRPGQGGPRPGQVGPRPGQGGPRPWSRGQRGHGFRRPGISGHHYGNQSE